MHIELLIYELTKEQAETTLGGYLYCSDDYPYAQIVNITESVKSKNKPKDVNINDIGNQKINTVTNSKKNYVNGIEIKEKRSITQLYFPI